LESVRRVPDLDAGVRDQLQGQLERALREAERRALKSSIGGRKSAPSSPHSTSGD